MAFTNSSTLVVGGQAAVKIVDAVEGDAEVWVRKAGGSAKLLLSGTSDVANGFPLDGEFRAEVTAGDELYAYAPSGSVRIYVLVRSASA